MTDMHDGGFLCWAHRYSAKSEGDACAGLSLQVLPAAHWQRMRRIMTPEEMDKVIERSRSVRLPAK